MSLLSKKFAARAGRVAIIGITTVGLTLGVTVGPAQAATAFPMSAVLSITSVGGGASRVVVSGFITLTEGQKRVVFRGGAKVVVRMWGDDSFSDDLLYGPATAQLTDVQLSTRTGVSYTLDLPRFPNSVLNEDDGLFDDGLDEIYAGVRLIAPDGTTTTQSRETNRVLLVLR